MNLGELRKDYPWRLDYSQFIGTALVGVGLFGDTQVESSRPSAEARLVSLQPTQSPWWALR